MYLSLQPKGEDGSGVILASAGGPPLTRSGLQEMLFPRGDGALGSNPGSPSFDPRLVESGGEAAVRLFRETVLRFEFKLLEPGVTEEERRLFLKKHSLAQQLRSVKGAVVPKQIILLEGSPPLVIGHTADFVEGFDPFMLNEPGDAALRWSAQKATHALIQLHDYISACHQLRITLGEVNPQNFGLDQAGELRAIDLLAYGYVGHECRTTFAKTVDPKLLDSGDKAKGWERIRKYSTDSDWFGFTVVAFETLLGVGPWGGAHRDQMKSPLLGQQRVRALRGLSILNEEINVNPESLRRRPISLGGELLEYFQSVFHRGVRGKFPRNLLTSLTWNTCSKCGEDYAALSHVCP